MKRLARSLARSAKTQRRCGFVVAVALASAITANAQEAALGGVKATVIGDQGSASIRMERLEAFKLRVEVNPKVIAKPPIVLVELPASGPNAWPSADVEARDESGKALLVQRSGIEWFNLHVSLPAGVTTFFVQAVAPQEGLTKPTTEKERTIQDTASGLRVQISKGHDGRAAAPSIRFDDSHPTCGTESSLFDQPLTVELTPPPAWNLSKITIKDSQGAVVPATPGKSGDVTLLRFAVAPRDAAYSIGVLQ